MDGEEPICRKPGTTPEVLVAIYNERAKDSGYDKVNCLHQVIKLLISLCVVGGRGGGVVCRFFVVFFVGGSLFVCLCVFVCVSWSQNTTRGQYLLEMYPCSIKLSIYIL